LDATMPFAIIGTSCFVSIAVIAVVIFPLPPRVATQPEGRVEARHGGGRIFSDIPSRLFASMASRISAEYHPSVARSAQQRGFWHNLQVLRLLSAYAIAYVHMDQVFSAVHVDPAVLDILRFGTDLFVVVAGFLTAHVIGATGKPAAVYLRSRLIRIVPLYSIFTVLAFLVENYAMRNQSNTLPELLMSLAFVAYGPFPILYPTWTLLVIVEFSLIIAAFQLVSMKYGVLYSAAFAVLLAAVGHVSGIKNPIFAFYTNPILIDFALGILVFKLVNSGLLSRKYPRRAAIALAATTVSVSAAAVILHPFWWPEMPRLLALGLPMSFLLLGVVVLERFDICRESKLVNFLAKCSYSIYLTHWFVNIVSDRLVAESAESPGIAAILLFVSPVIVTYVSVFVYIYAEVPLTRYLTDRFRRAEPRPA
jgi:exopolysaccharide production protein ExoZ